jgi:hypothetical protein
MKTLVVRSVATPRVSNHEATAYRVAHAGYCTPGKSLIYLSSPDCENIRLFGLPKSKL